MYRSVAARGFVAIVIASLCVVLPAGRAVTGTLAATTTTFCVEGLYSFIVSSSGAPGEVQDFRVASSPVGHINFALTTAGPFVDPLTIKVTIGTNGSGQTQFIAQGLAVGATTLNAINVGTGIVTNTLPVVVDKVDTITLEPKDPNHALDGDPNTPEPDAKRFFPDLDTPSADASASRSLTIKATLQLASPDVSVDFRFADVDDPSSDASPVDANGPAGVDIGNAVSPRMSTVSGRC